MRELLLSPSIPSVWLQVEYDGVNPGKTAADVAAQAGNTEVLSVLKGPIRSIPVVGPVLSIIVRPFVNLFREH